MQSEDNDSGSARLPRWPGCLLGLYAIACGAMALASFELDPAGWGLVTRPTLAVWGVAGGLLLWLGDPWWKPLLRFWALAQAVIVVVDPSGELTRQPGLWWGVQNTSWTALQGQVVSSQGLGVNLVGVVLLVLAHWIISRKWHPQVPVKLWQFQALRLVRCLFIGAHLLVAGYLAWHWAPLFIEKDRLMVLHSPLPGAQVYLEDRRLGSTPLVVTHDNLVSWGLSKPSGERRCEVKRSSLGEGFVLAGNSGSATLLLKPPGWCESRFVAWQSQWGPRAVPQHERSSSNRCETMLVSKGQPGLVLSAGDLTPRAFKAGQTNEFVVTMRCNPPDRRLASAPLPTGARAALVVTFQKEKGGASETRELPLPAEWAAPGAGSPMQHAVRVAVPQTPGKYTCRLRYQLLGGTPGQSRVEVLGAQTFTFVEVK